MTDSKCAKSNNLPNRTYYVHLVLFFMVCYLLFIMVMATPIAIYKSRNPENIFQGCLYQTGRYNGHIEPIFAINDEYKAVLEDMNTRFFPASKKHQSKYKTKHCYKVKYILVDFNIFTNYNIFKRYYIYDYVYY